MPCRQGAACRRHACADATALYALSAETPPPRTAAKTMLSSDSRLKLARMPLRGDDAAAKLAMTAALSRNLLAFLGAGSAAFGARLAQLVLFFVLAAFLLAVEANLAANLRQRRDALNSPRQAGPGPRTWRSSGRRISRRPRRSCRPLRTERGNGSCKRHRPRRNAWRPRQAWRRPYERRGPCGPYAPCGPCARHRPSRHLLPLPATLRQWRLPKALCGSWLPFLFFLIVGERIFLRG